ncbi:MAG: peptide-methionine (S)-S-oxide reductase MsrA [Bacteroidales bacterium]|nr:peptide-methionine (S)-S-oxide reductase MsrA [Bacteroidales bacterium]
MKTLVKLFIPALLIAALACNSTAEKTQNTVIMESNQKNYEYATIGGGCFWCIEAIFLEVRGVHSATSGYSGGTVKNPSYREVTSGRTGHAEVVQLVFDPEIISYKDILEIFFHLHDPTTLNRQGADIGTQYRSVIFYHNDEQEITARQVFEETDRSDLWENPLVTEISPLTEFYVAEDYHQNYFASNPNQPYCTFVISPKLSKLRKLFKDKL